MVLLSAGLAACAALPALLLPSIAMKAGVLGVAVAGCANDPLCDEQARYCADPNDKALAIMELPDLSVPDDEGNVATFEPAYWQSQFTSDVSARRDPAAEPSAGAFVITDKSVLFIPSSGIEGVRIPLVGVVDVQVQQNAATGAPRQMTVESCFGRLDRFTFGQRQQPRKLDSQATAASAAELRARVAAVRVAVQKEVGARH